MTAMGRAGAAIGLSEGQVYTAVTGLVVAVALLALGLPAIGDAAPTAAVGSAGAARSLALPGSPAVAEVISAPDPAPDAIGPSAPLSDGGSFADLGASGRSPVLGSSSPAIAALVADGPSTGAGAGGGPTATTTPAAEAPAAPTARRVQDGRYATASTPLVPAGEPGTFFPVALRVGATDKQSYLRLTGSDPVLRLALSTQPGHQVGAVDGVRACRIVTVAWTLEDGAPLTSAPELDRDDCVDGRPAADGWSFEVGRLDVTNGVALVPVGPATGTFQIVFQRPAT